MVTLPPYATLLKLRFEEAADGPVTVMPFHDDVVGAPGTLHGGAIAGLLEFAALRALAQALAQPLGGAAAAIKPITVTVDYMRPGTGRDTFASATVERLGARIANVEAFAWQKDRSSPIASARLNVLIDRAQ